MFRQSLNYQNPREGSSRSDQFPVQTLSFAKMVWITASPQPVRFSSLKPHILKVADTFFQTKLNFIKTNRFRGNKTNRQLVQSVFADCASLCRAGFCRAQFCRIVCSVCSCCSSSNSTIRAAERQWSSRFHVLAIKKCCSLIMCSRPAAGPLLQGHRASTPAEQCRRLRCMRSCKLKLQRRIRLTEFK